MNYRVLIFVVLVAYISEAHAGGVADASLWLHNKFSGKSCEDLNQIDLSNFRTYMNSQGYDCQIDHQPGEIQNLNEITESLFFNDLAKRQLVQTSCEISNIDRFSKDQSLIALRAEEIAAKMPFIKEQMHLANRAYYNYQQSLVQNNTIESFCRNSQESARKNCFEGQEKRRTQEKNLEDVWRKHRALALGNVASLWNGSTESMYTFIEKFARKSQLPSKEKIAEELKRQIPLVKKEISENRFELLDQSRAKGEDRVFDKLSDTTKRQLVEESINNGLFSRAVEQKDESMVKLLCRLEGKYTKGRDTLNSTAIASTFLLGGFAGLLSKIPVAVRAGQISTILAKARGSAAVVGALATGLDATAIADSIRRSCFTNNLKFVVSKSCPANAEDYKNNELKKIEQDNCILSAAMEVAPAGLLATSVAIKALSPTLKRYSQITNEMGENSVKDVLIADAEEIQERIGKRLVQKPDLSVERIRRNQREAEEYFKEKGLKVTAVKKELKVDSEKLQAIDKQIRGEMGEYQERFSTYTSVRDSALARRNRIRSDVKSIEDEIEVLKKLPEEYRQAKALKQRELDDLKTRRSSTELTANQKREMDGAIRDKAWEVGGIERNEARAIDDLAFKERLLGRERGSLEDAERNLNASNQYLAKIEVDHQSRLSELRASRESAENNPQEVIPYSSSVDFRVMVASFRGSKLTAAEREVLESTMDSRRVYTFSEIPKVNPRATASSPFWENPAFKDKYNEFRKMGGEVIIDPQMSDGASFLPWKKAIYVSPNAEYHIFEHEFTHAQFHGYLAQHVVDKSGIVLPKFREGSTLKATLPSDVVARIGERNIDYLQGLLQRYNKEITVDESLAVKKQLNSMGWRPLDSEYYWNKIYGGYYRIAELLETRKAAEVAKSAGTKGASPAKAPEFSPAQVQLLERELLDLGLNAAMLRGTHEVRAYLTTVRQDVSNGNIPAALATWRAIHSQLQRRGEDDSTYFYNENGDLIRISGKGSSIEYLNLKKNYD